MDAGLIKIRTMSISLDIYADGVATDSDIAEHANRYQFIRDDRIIVELWCSWRSPDIVNIEKAINGFLGLPTLVDRFRLEEKID